MIVFDASFDLIVVSGGTHHIKPIELNNGKFYLDENCYNANKTQIDALSIASVVREIEESEYIVTEV